MTKEATRRIVTAFSRAISANDVDAMASLMSADHAFIDSRDRRIEGKADCLANWQRVFDDHPGYAQSIASLVVRDDEVLVSGDVIEEREGPADHVLWRARCRDGKIAEWQVYRKPAHDALRDVA